MNIVAFGSGSCTTIEAILQYQKTRGDCGFKIAALVTDNAGSKSHEIAAREGIPLVHNDLKQFMQEKGLDFERKKDRHDLEMRIAFDKRTKERLLECAGQNKFRIDLICLAGYMLKLQPPITDSFAEKIINSHPANLTIADQEGKRKYTGADAVFDTILAGETETHTSIHIARKEIDAGEILVTSRPLPIDQKSVETIKGLSKNVEPDYRQELLLRDYDARKVKPENRDFSEDALNRRLIKKFVAEPHQKLQKHACDYPAYCFALEDTGKKLKTVLYKGERMPYGGVYLK